MNKRTKIALTLLAFVGLSFIGIPKLLSTSIVKERVERQLSEMTGRRVMLNGGSGISLSPYLGVTYNDVTIADDRDQPGKPLVTMDRLRAKLGLLGALWGDAKLAELELIRPHFNLHTDASGHRNWAADRGEVAAILFDPKAGPVPSLSLGSARIEDGIITMTDEQSRNSKIFTAVNGTVSWPNINSSSTGTLTWVWNGEISSFQFDFGNPYAYLRGDDSALTAAASAKPGEFRFSGTINRKQQSAQGELSVISRSPQRLFDWLGWNLPAAKKLESMSINGKAKLAANSLEYPDAKLIVGDHTGTGRLQLATNQGKNLSVSGTLAFDSIALANLSGFLATSPAIDGQKAVLDSTLLNGLTVDMRLSANTAAIGSLTITNLAASALVRDGVASFDIGGGETLGGNIAGSMELRSESEGASIHAGASLTGVDLSSLTSLYKANGVTLGGKGDLKFKLKSSGKTESDLVMRLNGDGAISSVNGSLTGLSFSNILKTVNSGMDSVVRISSEITNFKKLDLKFFIANGTAFLRDSALLTESLTVSLKGRSDLVEESLALRGTISTLPAEGSKAQELPFFIGGTLSAPLFVPLPLKSERAATPSQGNPKTTDE